MNHWAAPALFVVCCLIEAQSRIIPEKMPGSLLCLQVFASLCAAKTAIFWFNGVCKVKNRLIGDFYVLCAKRNKLLSSAK
jgi:hypothetical protein